MRGPVGKTNEALGGLLLPGILDEITIDNITPKLSWRDFHSLSSVSRGWYHAIRGRRVYDARVRAGSTETIVVMNYITHTRSENFTGIALYSPRDKSFYQLPLPPNLHRGIPSQCQCVSLDGKIYLLGGEEEFTAKHGCQVYVFDLAGKRNWEKCASMGKGREDFGCAVLGGKIYVSGGTWLSKFVYGAEVYEPQYDAWSPITPMKSLRYEHHVEVLGEELVVHSGKVLDPLEFDFAEQRMLHVGPEGPQDWFSNHVGFRHVYDADTLEFYHPVKDEWRVVESSMPLGSMPSRLLFTAQGKFYSVESEGIDVYDADKNLWRELHSSSFPEIPEDSNSIQAVAVVAVDDQLVAVVERDGRDPHFRNIYQCKRFGSGDKELVWEEVPFFHFPCEGFPDGTQTNYFMSTVQL